MKRTRKQFFALLLTLTLFLTPLPVFAEAGRRNECVVAGTALDAVREEYFGEAQETGLEVINIDNSNVIHRPQEYPEPVSGAVSGGITPFAFLEDLPPGPFNIDDEREFFVDVTSGTTKYKVRAHLRGQSNHTNVWVLDDTHYHAVTGTSHNGNCHLRDDATGVTPAMAQEVAAAFDGIYTRMTAAFGAHNGILLHLPYSNVEEVGDYGEDGKVNFLLYDLDGDGGGSGSYTGGFFSSGDFFDHPTLNPDSNKLDMLHIDIGENQGYNALISTGAPRLNLYNTLAHEFQHMLFYMYFGMYPNSSSGDATNGVTDARAYSWFNESLSELAGAFFVQEGAEVVDNRITSAAPNEYYPAGYQTNLAVDFLRFDNLKHYGMVSMFSRAMYKRYGDDYTRGIYDTMRANYPPPVVDDYQYILNENAVGSSVAGHDKNIGNFLRGGTGIGTGGRDSFSKVYTMFMENFAADGGVVRSASPSQTVKFYEVTDTAHNLWNAAPRNGSPATLPPATISGLSVKAYGSNLGSGTNYPPYGGAPTLEQIYCLNGYDAVVNKVLTITIDDDNPDTHYYIAVPNTGSPNGATGADVYPFAADGTPFTLNTNGRPAFLFVSTFYREVNTSVYFEWGPVATDDLVGAVTLSPTTPKIGENVTAIVTPVGTYDYAWTLGGNPVGTNSASFTIPDDAAGVGKVLSVTVTAAGKTGQMYGQTTAIAKKANATTPSAPTQASQTPTSITLAPVAGYEYSQGGALWQSSNVFQNLLTNTPYTFYQRIKATDTMAASAASAGATFTPLPPALTAIISLDKTGTQTFAGAAFGYGAQTALTVKVNSEGTGATGALTVALSGADAANFTLSDTAIASIAAGGNASFTVRPNTGLSPATYNATITVSGTGLTEQSFDVSFTVSKAAGSFGTPSAINTTYTPTLTLADISLPAGYAWNAPATAITAAGNGQTFAATYTHASGNYTAATGSITVNVAKATGSFGSPAVINITYSVGLTLAGVTPPEGYVWNAPTTALSVGSGSYPATFTDTSGNYTAATGSITVNVSTATGDFGSPSAINATYVLDLTLADLTLPMGYAWIDGTISLNAGNGQSFPATYTAEGFSTATGSIIVNVAKATGSFGSPAAINITYTQSLTLADLTLPADYTWNAPTTGLNAADGQSFAATYTHPSGNYTTATGNITINVAKATGSFGSPSALNIIYAEGLTLAGISLPTGYSWNAGTTAVNAGNDQTFAATYTHPSGNYTAATGSITVNLAKATGSFGSPAVISVTYTSGLTLSGITLPTGYSWNAGTTAVNAGNGQSFAATYTHPSGNFTMATGNITVNVAKATGSFGSPSAINITYSEGLTLSGITLPTGYSWNAGATAVHAGNGQSFAATYTHASGNYTAATGNITVNVAKATGSFGSPAAINVTYIPGLTLAGVTLPSGYTWNDDTTALTAGNNQSFAATYTHAGGNYTAAAGSITVNVASGTGEFGTPTAINTTYAPGLVLADLALPTGYTWADDTIALAAGDGQSFAAEYTDTDSSISMATGTITVNVAKATGSFVTTTPISITYAPGLTLAGVTLPTGYAWADVSTVLNAGDGQTIAIHYTDASGNYLPAAGMVTVNVAKLAITVTADAKTKAFGGSNPPLTYTVVPSIGSDVLTGSLTYIGTDIGSYDIVEGTAFAHTNYTITFVKGTMTITLNPAMQAAVDAINALPNPVRDWTDTDKVADATRAYDQLTAAEKAQLLAAVAMKLATAQDQANSINHAKDGVSGTSATLPWYVRLVVEPITQGDARYAAFAAKHPDSTLVALYDLQLRNTLTGEKHTPADAVVISLTGLVLEGKDIVILHEKVDGTLETLTSTISGGAVVFDAFAFSLFGVADMSVAPAPPATATPEPSATPDVSAAPGISATPAATSTPPANSNPVTGDDALTLMWLVLCGVAVLVGGFVMHLRKKNSRA